jgi:hypothetical protein
VAGIHAQKSTKLKPKLEKEKAFTQMQFTASVPYAMHLRQAF